MYWITGFVGLLFVAAPFALGYSDHAVALWTSVILGAAIALVSAIKGFLPEERANWEYWVAGLVGIAALIAPYALGFSDHAAALWSSLIIGAAVALLSGYQVLWGQAQPRPT